jgi:uncharacterized membrane protein
MENNALSKIWEGQNSKSSLAHPKAIIKKARQQRHGQFITIVVLCLTLIVLVAFTMTYALGNWNNFTLGLVLMISSITFRLILEYLSIYRKKSRLITMDNQGFASYLKTYYRKRIRINYIITPLCFIVYIIGFIKLLPYFKNEFSESFYTYILISGIGSLLAVAAIVVNSILKEQAFLNQWKPK